MIKICIAQLCYLSSRKINIDYTKFAQHLHSLSTKSVIIIIVRKIYKNVNRLGCCSGGFVVLKKDEVIKYDEMD